MNFIAKIKKFFEPKEAPYNWGASIDHLRIYIDSHIGTTQNRIKELEQRQSSYFNSVVLPLGGLIDDQKERISKLESEVKKLKKKPKIKK